MVLKFLFCSSVVEHLMKIFSLEFNLSTEKIKLSLSFNFFFYFCFEIIRIKLISLQQPHPIRSKCRSSYNTIFKNIQKKVIFLTLLCSFTSQNTIRFTFGVLEFWGFLGGVFTSFQFFQTGSHFVRSLTKLELTVQTLNCPFICGSFPPTEVRNRHHHAQFYLFIQSQGLIK